MHSPRCAGEFSSRSLPYTHCHPHGVHIWVELAAAACSIVPPPLTVRAGLALISAVLSSTSVSPSSPPPLMINRSPPKRKSSSSLMSTTLSPLSSSWLLSWLLLWLLLWLLSQSSLSSSCLPSPSSSSPSQSSSTITLFSSKLKAKSPPWAAKMGSKSRTPKAVWAQPVLAEGLTPTVWIELSPPPVTSIGWLTSPVSQSCSVS